MIKLVLVESPSKCNQIEKYLCEEYKVLATYGHFRELSCEYLPLKKYNPIKLSVYLLTLVLFLF